MKRTFVLVAIAGTALVIGSLTLWRLSRPDADQLLREARHALERDDNRSAEALALRALQSRAGDSTALVIAAEAAVGQRAFGRAVVYYLRVPPSEPQIAAAAAARAADLLLRPLCRPSEAERQYRRSLELAPEHVPALHGLATLLGMTGRRWEAVPLVVALIRQGAVSVDQLVLLGTEGGSIRESDLLEQCRSAAPADATVLLGLGVYAMSDGQFDRARRHLQAAVARDPMLIEAQAWLGKLLLEHGTRTDFLAWHAALPRKADEHPSIWAVRGRHAERVEEPDVALRCFAETLRRDPNHRTANYQLGRLLHAAGRTDEAAAFQERSEQLLRLKRLQDILLNSPHDSVEPLRQFVLQLEQLGRTAEAVAWSRIAQRLDPRAAWAAERVARGTASPGDLAYTTRDENSALALDVAALPLPQWTPPAAARPQSVPESDPGRIAFEDTAEAAGLRFRYVNGGDPATPGQFMYEFTGGGVAVLDYDADGWPDLHLTQGGGWPPAAHRDEPLDRLFRNRGDGRFEDATLSAGLHEDGFSQGVTVGDYNGDGFADLYVANIGGNRLFRNNGDGTFSDVTDISGTAGDEWTTSCLLADLNGDALPDIYAVNYLEGADLFTRICAHGDGAPRMCLPFQFPACQDRLYVNLGDGRFADRTEAAGLVAPQGKGLGVVAADFDASGTLDLFVANDTTPNFLFLNQSPRGTGVPLFHEVGMTAGAAVDATGRAQGCMGIALGDADGDGRCDLFVTNFHQEPNTLYVGRPGATFLDETRDAGLYQPGLEMLGFGTQFLDADLDGWPDLIVANGHIDDLRAYGRPYQMPAQVFRNRGDGRFAEVPAAALGPYFQGQHLGRGLARLDWNRDGRPDAAVTHLDAPAALLTNRSPRTGHFLSLALRGTDSDRDAIGSVVTVTAGGRTWVEHLSAGDGYHAGNERRLLFGLGEHGRVDRLHIRWPSGREQTFANLPADRHVLAVEGRERLFSRVP